MKQDTHRLPKQRPRTIAVGMLPSGRDVTAFSRKYVLYSSSEPMLHLVRVFVQPSIGRC